MAYLNFNYTWGEPIQIEFAPDSLSSCVSRLLASCLLKTDLPFLLKLRRRCQWAGMLGPTWLLILSCWAPVLAGRAPDFAVTAVPRAKAQNV